MESIDLLSAPGGPGTPGPDGPGPTDEDRRTLRHAHIVRKHTDGPRGVDTGFRQAFRQAKDNAARSDTHCPETTPFPTLAVRGA